MRAISMQSETGAAHGHSTSTPVKTKPGPVRTCLCYKRRVAGVTELEVAVRPRAGGAPVLVQGAGGLRRWGTPRGLTRLASSTLSL